MSKSLTKNLVKTAVGTTAALGIFGNIVYECVLNIRLAAKIAENVAPATYEIPEDIKTSLQANLPSIEKYSEFEAEWRENATPQDIYIEGKDGQQRHAIVIDNGHPEKWAVIFHGYTSEPAGMFHYAACYTKMGFNCILPSMIGHGKDTHRYCSMGYHDRYMGVDWLNYIATLYPDCEIVIHGESMGAATTMLVTGEELPENVKAAVSDCGFTNVFSQYVHVTKTQMSPALIPLLPLVSKISEVRGNFNFKKCSPVDAVKYSKTPTLFVHGEADNFVPFSMLNEVYSACAAPKEFFTVKGAEHAASSRTDPKLYWTNVYNFLKDKVTL